MFRGKLAAGDLDAGGEDLRDVALPHAIGEARGRGVVAFERGVAEDAQGQGVTDRLGRGPAVAADDREGVARHAGDEHDFARAVGLNLVADTEAVAVGDIEAGLGGGRADRAVVDRVAVGQQLVLEPLVNGRGGGPLRVAEVIQQRSLVGADDADDIADVFNEFGQ